MPVSTSGDVSHRLFLLWERSPDLDAHKGLHYSHFLCGFSEPSALLHFIVLMEG